MSGSGNGPPDTVLPLHLKLKIQAHLKKNHKDIFAAVVAGIAMRFTEFATGIHLYDHSRPDKVPAGSQNDNLQRHQTYLITKFDEFEKKDGHLFDTWTSRHSCEIMFRFLMHVKQNIESETLFSKGLNHVNSSFLMEFNWWKNNVWPNEED